MGDLSVPLCPFCFALLIGGRCPTCVPSHCAGCDQQRPTRTYTVTFHDGTSESCRYCADCVDLARMDWNGETAGVSL